jgi:hypothetical protein
MDYRDERDALRRRALRVGIVCVVAIGLGAGAIIVASRMVARTRAASAIAVHAMSKALAVFDLATGAWRYDIR